MDLSCIDGRQGLFLSVKDASPACVPHHFFVHGRFFDHTALRGEAAFQHSDTAPGAVGPADWTDDGGVSYLMSAYIFSYGFPCTGKQLCMQEVSLTDFMHHGRDAACFFQFLYIVVSCGRKAAQIRCFL